MDLQQEIVYQGKPYILTGTTGYSVGYTNAHSMSGNLIIVEGKRKDGMTAVYGQLLSYMGKSLTFFAGPTFQILIL